MAKKSDLKPAAEHLGLTNNFTYIVALVTETTLEFCSYFVYLNNIIGLDSHSVKDSKFRLKYGLLCFNGLIMMWM